MTTSTDSAATTNAYDTLASIFTQYGLESLVPSIKSYMQQGITDQAALMLTLRASPEYAARFPAMKALNAKGQGFSEADYINYERNAATTEQQYGFPKGFLTDPHRIQNMLENNVSASEVNTRAQINAAASLTAPQETKDALKNLYGLDQASLAAFYYDPENSLPYLQKQFSAASIAGEAAKQAIGLNVTQAEALAAQGVTNSQAASGFAQVANTQGLTVGAGETVNQQTLIDAAFGKADATQQVQRVGQGRINQFQGSGGAQAVQGGVSGLGSSGTR
jgi:hypothetical protein